MGWDRSRWVVRDKVDNARKRPGSIVSDRNDGFESSYATRMEGIRTKDEVLERVHILWSEVVETLQNKGERYPAQLGRASNKVIVSDWRC